MIPFLLLILLFSFLLIKNKKVRAAILSASVLIAIYSAFITFTPVCCKDTGQKETAAAAYEIIDRHLNDQKYAAAGMLSAYRIHSAKFVAFENERYIYASFDVKPRIKTTDYSGWLNGNGKEGKDGWVIDKIIYFKYQKIGDWYIITDAGNTGL